MTRKTRYCLRVALVASLTSTMTVSPALAGRLFQRLGCKPAPNCCVPMCPTIPVCPPVTSCPPIVVCEPLCCDTMPLSGQVVMEQPVEQAEPTTAPPTKVENLEPMPVDPPIEPQPTTPEPETPAEPEAPAVPVIPAVPEPGSPSDNVPAEEPAAEEPTVPSPFDQEPAAEEPADLFGDEPAAEPAPAEEPADLFGDEPAAEPAPAEEPVADDPLNLFGEEPTPAEPAGEEPLDLFGEEPAAQPPASDEPIDLFGDEPASEEPATGEGLLDDILGGDQPAADPVPAPADDSFDDIFGDPAPAGEAPADAGGLFDEPAAGGGDEGGLFGEPLNPTSLDEEKPADVSPKNGESNIFDELFGNRDASQAAELTSQQVAPAAVSIAASSERISPLETTQSRLWIDNTGHFSTEGRLIYIGETNVRLLKSNGRTCTVEFDRLSASDAEYVAELRQAMANAAALVSVQK